LCDGDDNINVKQNLPKMCLELLEYLKVFVVHYNDFSENICKKCS